MNKLNFYAKINGEIIVNDKVQKKIVIFKSIDNSGFVVDGIASEFCQKIDGKTKLQDIHDNFVSKYSKEINEISSEIINLINSLEQENLIEFLDKPLETIDLK